MEKVMAEIEVKKKINCGKQLESKCVLDATTL